MATQWYCRLMGTELGPFTSKELLEMARSHQLMPDDSVKKEVDGMWVGAHRVKGLFDDPALSSIIIASLPQDVKQALESAQHTTEEAEKPVPRPVMWYYISDQSKVGPLSFDELMAHGRQGLVKPKCRVWSSKSPKWCEAKEVEGLVFDQSAETQRT